MSKSSATFEDEQTECPNNASCCHDADDHVAVLATPNPPSLFDLAPETPQMSAKFHALENRWSSARKDLTTTTPTTLDTTLSDQSCPPATTAITDSNHSRGTKSKNSTTDDSQATCKSSVFERLYQQGKIKIASARKREEEQQQPPKRSSPGDDSISSAMSQAGTSLGLYTPTITGRHRQHDLGFDSKSFSSLERRMSYATSRGLNGRRRHHHHQSIDAQSLFTTTPSDALNDSSSSFAEEANTSVFERLYRGEKRSTTSLLFGRSPSQSPPKNNCQQKITPETNTKTAITIDELDATPLRKGNTTTTAVIQPRRLLHDDDDDLSDLSATRGRLDMMDELVNDDDDVLLPPKDSNNDELSSIQDYALACDSSISTLFYDVSATASSIASPSLHQEEKDDDDEIHVAVIQIQCAWRRYWAERICIRDYCLSTWMVQQQQQQNGGGGGCSQQDWIQALFTCIGFVQVESLKRVVLQEEKDTTRTVEWKHHFSHVTVFVHAVCQCPTWMHHHWSPGKIQSRILASTLTKAWQEEREDVIRNESASQIQKHIRGRSVRRKSNVGPAAIRIQTAWRCHRAQIRLCMRLLQSWWVNCDFNCNRLVQNKILLLRIGVVGVTRAGGRVDCLGIIDCLQVNEERNSVEIEWEREIGVDFSQQGQHFFESCTVRLKSQPLPKSFMWKWGKKKVTILFIKATLELCLIRDTESLRRFAACTIQRAYRRMSNQELLAFEDAVQGDIESFVDISSLHQHAAFIQACWRRWIRQDHYLTLKSSAIAFQSAWRMHEVRMGFSCIVMCIVVIQSRARSFQAQVAYRKVRRGMLILQARARGMQVRGTSKCLSALEYDATQTDGTTMELEQDTSSAMLIQKTFRLHRQRKRFLRRRTLAVKVQSLVRAHQAVTLCQELRSRHQVACEALCATKLQSRWRAYSATRRFSTQRLCVVAIQAWVRGSACRIQQKEYSKNAKLIQRAWEESKRKESLQRRHTSIVTIQAVIRCAQSCHRYQCMRLNAIKIQSLWRRHQATLLSKYQRAQETSDKFASCIQTAWRMNRTREVYLRLRTATVLIQGLYRKRSCVFKFRSTVALIVKLQSWYRCHQLTNVYWKQMKSAILIQSAVRSHQVSQLCAQRLTQNINSACAIQRLWRGHIARKWYGRAHAVTVLIQGLYRKHRSQREFKSTLSSILKIQSWYRSQHLMKLYQEKLGTAILIQSIWRGFCSRRVLQFAGRQSSAIRIQACWRGFHVNATNQRRTKAAVRIQAAQRGRLQRGERKCRLQAIIQIQAYSRGRLAQISMRRDQQEKLRGVIVLQASARSFQGRKVFQRILEATLVLQAWVRGYIARKVVAVKTFQAKEERDESMRILQATLLVQACARGHIAQKVVAVMASQAKEQREAADRAESTRIVQATLLVQACARGHIARKVVAVMAFQAKEKREAASRAESMRRDQQEKLRGVTVLQASIRSFQGRKAFLRIVQATLLVQACVRGHIARKVVAVQAFQAKEQRQAASRAESMLRDQQEKLRSITILQAFIRSVQGRKAFQRILQATLLVQACVRGHIARKVVAVQAFQANEQRQAADRAESMRRDQQEKLLSITVLQAFSRSFQGRKAFQRIRQATLLLQAWVRGYIARKVVAVKTFEAKKQREEANRKLHALARFQSIIKAGILSRRFLLMKRAADVIKRAYFSWAMILELESVESSIILLQRSVRGQLARSATRFALRHANASFRSFDRLSQLSFGTDIACLVQWVKAKRVTQNAAIVVIQSAVRRLLAIVSVQAMVQHYPMQPDSPSTKVGARWRIILLRQEEHATDVQRVFRGYVLRKFAANQLVAALIIQATYRQYRDSRHQHQQLEAAAVLMQAMVRSHCQRKRFVVVVQKTWYIQSVWRRRVSIAVEQEQRSAATAIQHWYRQRARNTAEKGESINAASSNNEDDNDNNSHDSIGKNQDPLDQETHALEAAILSELEAKAEVEIQRLMLRKSSSKRRRRKDKSACVQKLARRVKSVPVLSTVKESP